MKITIEGTVKEIADLVREIQDRQERRIVIDPEAAVRAICDNTPEAPEQSCS